VGESGVDPRAPPSSDGAQGALLTWVGLADLHGGCLERLCQRVRGSQAVPGMLMVSGGVAAAAGSVPSAAAQASSKCWVAVALTNCVLAILMSWPRTGACAQCA